MDTVTVRVELYNYADFLGAANVIMESALAPKEKGEKVEINFDNADVKFEEGLWQRPTGTFEFTAYEVHQFSFKKTVVTVQLAVEDLEEE